MPDAALVRLAAGPDGGGPAPDEALDAVLERSMGPGQGVDGAGRDRRRAPPGFDAGPRAFGLGRRFPAAEGRAEAAP